MRVLWYWPFAYPDDLALAEAFASRGHELTVQTIDRRHLGRLVRPSFRHLANLPDVAEYKSRGIRWLFSRAATYLARARLRNREVATSCWDVVHVMFLNYFTDGLALPRLSRRAPLVLTVHDVIPHTPRLPDSILRSLLGRIYDSCPTLVVHNEHVRDHLGRVFSVDVDRVSVVPLPNTSPPTEHGQVVLQDQSPTLLFFGSFRQNKGIPLLLEAIQLTRQSPSTTLRFHFAGHGREDLEDAIRLAARQDPRITYDIGRITTERKRELFGRALLIVLPYSNFHSQSGVLQDAYGFGVPVVASRSGSLGHMVEADKTGWTVDCSDAEELARVLVEAARDQSARTIAARNARRLALERSPEAIAQALESVYRRAWRRFHGAGKDEPPEAQNEIHREARPS